MAKTRRVLRLVHLLSDTGDGLTLDEMAAELEVNRRTAERLRDVIDEAFGLETIQDDRRKRFRIPEGLRRAYTRPNAAEVAALQTEVAALRARGVAHVDQLESLLGKVKGALDDRERRRLDPNLDALVRLQRGRVTAGPLVPHEPEVLAAIQGAILAGSCLEFDYRADAAAEPRWRRVVPYGLVHGSIAYLVGKMPGREEEPAFYRLDRMSDVRASNHLGCAPEDWDLDGWLAQSFGIWRQDAREIVLRVAPSSAQRAREWRFHPEQILEEGEGGELFIRFQSGGCANLDRALDETSGGGERARFQDFFHALLRMDARHRIYDLIWTRFPHEIRLLLDNRYVFGPFWLAQSGATGGENWEERFDAAKRAVGRALKSHDTPTLLSILFDRLYGLRNQLVHGGATWDSTANRNQVRDGAALLGCLLPVFIDLMMDHPVRSGPCRTIRLSRSEDDRFCRSSGVEEDHDERCEFSPRPLQIAHRAFEQCRKHDPTGARAVIDGWGWARAWLDFETINPAIPRWVRRGPINKFPFSSRFTLSSGTAPSPTRTQPGAQFGTSIVPASRA